MALWRLHAQRVNCSSYKIEHFVLVKNFLNLEGYQNVIIDIGLKVTAVLPNGGILPHSGVESGGYHVYFKFK